MTVRPRLVRIFAMTAAAALVFAGGCGPATDGPIDVGDAHGWIVPDRVPVGDRFTDGFEVLLIEGDDSVTIDAVRSVGAVDGLKQAGVHLSGDDRAMGAIQYDRDFPPGNPEFGTLLPAVGETIEPRPGLAFDSWELIIGYEVTAPGRWQRDEIEVFYTVRGEEYVVNIPAELVVCSPDVVRCIPSR